MAYRNELEAQRARTSNLRQQLARIDRQLAELEPLARRRVDVGRELAEAQRDLRAKTRLPMLQRIRVASPCRERWDDMTGDERVRHCSKCTKDVYDLSAMTEADAEALLQERGVDLCVRFYRRADGTIMTADCPVGARRRRVQNAVYGAVAVAAAAVGIGATVAATRPVMGDISVADDSDSEPMMGAAVPIERNDPAFDETAPGEPITEGGSLHDSSLDDSSLDDSSLDDDDEATEDRSERSAPGR